MKLVGKFGWVTALLVGIGMYSCDETFELNAPYEDIYVVYGILDPTADTQHVRISLGFLPEEDAVEFARDYDGAIPGLSVMIIGDDISVEGEFIGDIAKSDQGDFADSTGAYRFITSGNSRLKSGGKYQLEIRRPDEPEFLLEASTRIPNEPRILSPTRFASSGEYCLPTINVEDTVSVLIKLNETPDNQSAYFEVRWLLRYEEGGKQWELSTRPSPIFNKNVRCALAGNGNLCYSTGNGSVLDQWKVDIPEEAESLPINVRCSRIPIELTRNAELQVTALDSVLSKYILANDPKEKNFNTIRREFTNISGTAMAVGVFGSIAYDNEPFLLSRCAENELGLMNDPTACR